MMDACWALLELLGHRQRAGWLSEEEIAGAGFLRLDVPQQGDPPMRTEYYGTAAVYAIHPSDEETVRKFNEPRKMALAYLPASEREFDPFSDCDEDDGEPECPPEEAERARYDAIVEDGETNPEDSSLVWDIMSHASAAAGGSFT